VSLAVFIWLALLVFSGFAKVRKKIYIDEYLQIASYIREIGKDETDGYKAPRS
jgi:hypothetical protein